MNGRWMRFFAWPRNNDADEESDDTEEENDDIDDGAEHNSDEMGNHSARAVSRPVSEITFDKSLPRAHSYLGNDLEDMHGRTIHDDESLVSLPVLTLNNVVLLPGQILPLFLYQPVAVSMIKRVLDKDRTFGYIAASDDHGTAAFGTTAEILAVKEDHDEASGLTATKVKAIGRQRFAVIKTKRQIDGILTADVKILAEKIMSDPLDGATPASYRCSNYNARLNQYRKPSTVSLSSRKRKADYLYGGNFTHWSPWVYRQYDILRIMADVKQELQSWNESFSVESMPSDPVEFSYWVAGSLPFEDGFKLKLLKIDSAIQRLRCELNIMRRCTVMCCAQCNSVITNKNDVFSMSVEGPLGAYVNPGGYVHETLTVVHVRGLRLVGHPSEEHSWFPGYEWTIAQCRTCASHMGWKFTVASGRQLKPVKFYGLCRSALKPDIQKDTDNVDEAWVPTV